MADYDLSTVSRAGPRLQVLGPYLEQYGITEDRVLPLLEARTEVLERALRHVHDEWGGFDRYAINCLGLASNFPNDLRSALTI